MKEEILKTYHQESRIKKSISTFIGSTLIIVSTILPCLDRILVWRYPELDVLTDSRGVLISSNIWIGSVYLSPVLIITSYFFKINPKLLFYPLLVFFYSAIVYYSPIFGYDVKFLKLNSWLALLLSAASAFAYILVFTHMKWLKLEENANEVMVEDFRNEYTKLVIENESLKKRQNTLEKN